ncbi:wall-associated receptor kinase-like 8 [Populus alba x Populus x berolinensis]|nr:wall-associated receptor kinase-like 8 [Populus alba x Populus x berolinensis]
MEVLNISVKTATATVKSPVISFNCAGRKDGGSLDLTGSPFFFSDFRNVFIAVGCDTRALMSGIEPDLAGCVPTCGNQQSRNCCQASIPPLLQVFKPTLVSTIVDQGREACKLAVLVNRTWFASNTSDPFALLYKDYVPANLGWVMNVNYSDISIYCYTYYNESLQSEFACSSPGFEGNPYLELGCIDVDECKTPEKNTCQGMLKCVNTRGGYRCAINKIYIIIIVVGSVIFILVLLFGLWRLYKLIKKRQNRELKKKFFKRNGGLLLQQQLSTSDGSVQKTKIYSSKELEVATDGFNVNRILGEGGQGTVYKGMLTDGRIIAVKKSKVVDEENLEEFINEVVILSQINHRNVVKLLGCCLETEVPILVYEFISNGNLYKYIHVQDDNFLLSWDMRLRIAIEVAGALSYLHSAASIPV